MIIEFVLKTETKMSDCKTYVESTESKAQVQVIPETEEDEKLMRNIKIREVKRV